MRQAAVHRFSYDGMYEVSLSEPHLGLMRMDIDIDILWGKRQEHKHHRMAFLRQDMAVGFRERMQEDAIAHDASVDEEVLGVATRTAPRRWGHEPGKQQRALSLFNGDQLPADLSPPNRG